MESLFFYEGQFCLVWFVFSTFWMHHFTLSWLVVYAEKSASCLMEAPLVYGVLFSFSFKILSLPLTRQFKKEMATHSSTFVWKIPWMEEPGRLQSMGLQRVGHDWATSLSFYSSFWRRKWQPTPVLLSGKSHGQISLEGYSQWGFKKAVHDLAT